METRFVEVTNNNQNWGKFALGKFDEEELRYRSLINDHRLIQSRGWDSDAHLMVFDLQTGEGAFFKLGGLASYDLKKHRIWVCPMFEPFLEYLYQWYLDGKDPFDLPGLINLPNAKFEMAGYRREGPGDDILDTIKTALKKECTCHEAECIHDKIRDLVNDRSIRT